MDKILLIDGHNALWRSCVKFGDSSHSLCWDCDKLSLLHRDSIEHCSCGGAWLNGHCEEEQEDHVIFTFNFFRNLRPIIEMFSPDKCFFVLEGHPQFRYDLFADYKANRIVKLASKKETTDVFYKTKDLVLEIIKYLPITLCRAANYEADDVIATLCENMKEEDLTILSGDSDFIQLLQKNYNNIKIYNPIKKSFLEAPTYSYIVWKCLAGDKSDNIPKILSPKKALKAASEPEVFKKFLEVEENRANFSINKDLIEFRSVPEEEISIINGDKNFDKLKEKFIELKFNSITNDKSWSKYKSTFDCIKY